MVNEISGDLTMRIGHISTNYWSMGYTRCLNLHGPFIIKLHWYFVFGCILVAVMRISHLSGSIITGPKN